MRTSIRLVFVVTALVAGAAAAQAQCVTKAGKGTGNDNESAKFQAWEAVLQATSWGSWGSWMVSSQEVGIAPGYKVSNLKSRCKAGGWMGRECIVQARLCK